jgi:hypothetical protein
MFGWKAMWCFPCFVVTASQMVGLLFLIDDLVCINLNLFGY